MTEEQTKELMEYLDRINERQKDTIHHLRGIFVLIFFIALYFAAR